MLRFDRYVGVALIVIVAGLGGAALRLRDETLLILLIPAAISMAAWFRFRARFSISVVATELAGLALLVYSLTARRGSARPIAAVMVLMALALMGAGRRSPGRP